MTKRFIGTVAAAAIALTTMTAVPARAELSDFEKFLLGAGTLLIIGGALSNSDRDRGAKVYREDHRDRDRDRDRHVTRRVDPDRHVHVRPRHKVVPTECLRRNRWDEGPRRFFGKRCLKRHDVNVRRLPRSCERTIHTNNGRFSVFAARCLRERGWVFG